MYNLFLNSYFDDARQSVVDQSLVVMFPGECLEMRDDRAVKQDLDTLLADPRLSPERLSGKRLILDLRAIDEQGQRYNIEMQVRRFPVWSARGTLYLAQLLSEQPSVGDDYRKLKPVIGSHLG
jgi:hypothetical protein